MMEDAILRPADAGRLQQRVRPAPEKMLPFEWLYWSLVDAKMHREAEGMDFALRQIKFMSEEANWQADRRLAAQREVERLRAALRAIVALADDDVLTLVPDQAASYDTEFVLALSNAREVLGPND